MKKRWISLLLALVMVIGLFPAVLAAETVPTDFDWKVSKSKTATDLDADGSTRVTLSLPSAEETLTSDVVFVLDGSSSTDENVVVEALRLLEELKQAAKDNGATVNVCVVKFKRQAFKSDWYDLATGFDSIKAAMKSTYRGGTNIHAGLLAGKEAMEEHTNVSANRKYLVLISDGSTYLYSKDGNWASDTPFTRSYHPTGEWNQTGGFWDSGWYEPNAYDVNVPRPKKTSDVATWQKYLKDVEARNKESNGDDYDYHFTYDLDKGILLSPDFKPQPAEKRSANNRDMAFYYADQVWQQLKKAGYNVFSVATDDMEAKPGNWDDSYCFMNYLNGGRHLNFSDIKNEILYAVGAGSTVEDYMGYDTRNGNNYNFDLVPGSLILTVGGQSLASKRVGNTYYFGNTGVDLNEKNCRFQVVYTPADDGSEKFVWTINEHVSNFSRVQLSYQLRLRDDARTSKDNYFYTNFSATLTPKDSGGKTGINQTFDRPRVTFGLGDADYLLPILNLKKAAPKLNTRDHFAYVQGYPDGTVKPAGSITRAEVAAILFRLMDADSRSLYYSTASGFRDVDSTKWYNTYVATLNNAGVITDSRTGYFRPNDAITRAELAAMLAQFAEKKSAAIYFSDVSAGYWAANAIALTANLGWINGYPDGTFGPDKTVTRAELMAMVNRATGRAPESTSALLSGMKTWKDNADTARWYYLDVQEATNSHTYLGAPTETWTSLTATPDWSQYE